MGSEDVLDIIREALKVSILISAPLLFFGLAVGVITNIFQAVTQISETTLAVVPKILAMMLAFVIFSPWMIDVMTSFTVDLFTSIPSVVR